MLLVIGESGSRFEETGRRRRCSLSFNHPISARRNLFGSPDPAENKADLRYLSERLTVDACERWSFDFPTGKPIDGGRYEWKLCSDGKDTTVSSENEAVFQPPNSSRDDSDNNQRRYSSDERVESGPFSWFNSQTAETSPNSTVDDGRFLLFASSRVSASRDDRSEIESLLPDLPPPTTAKDGHRSFSSIRDDDAAAVKNCVSSENPKRFQNSKQSLPQMLRRRGFGKIRHRRPLGRQSRSSVEKTLSSFITDYFPKKKRSGDDCNRDPK